ncbi:hypothetical protein BaRGS_00029471 [Batillaria attramentaria]|uniref:Uncharacterized protein n=1 Tax=Batillaria attramentaria TaxID=370345 RepID=A0ABD0JW60_9CAEN
MTGLAAVGTIRNIRSVSRTSATPTIASWKTPCKDKWLEFVSCHFCCSVLRKSWLSAPLKPFIVETIRSQEAAEQAQYPTAANVSAKYQSSKKAAVYLTVDLVGTYLPWVLIGPFLRGME